MNALRFWGSLAASAIFATAAIAQTPSLSGTWNASFASQVGKQTYTYTFKVDGAKLTGHSKSNFGESELTGTVDQDKVTFVENLNFQDMPLVITYTGQLVSADEIKFKRDVGGPGGEDFTAVRQK